ncbi:MAG: SPOR domain-containing protein [Xanthobacteraceae bacterium]
MSMADDQTFRSSRATDTYRRSAAPAHSSSPSTASDPLAELARLIGQTDPFGDLGRGGRNSAHPPYEREADPAPAQPSRPAQAYERGHEESRFTGRQDYYPQQDFSSFPSQSRDERYRDVHDEDQFDADQGSAGAHSEDSQFGAYAEHEAEDDRQSHYGDEEHSGDPVFYQEDAPLPPDEDEMYDDAPRRRTHSGLATALALIGCAMLGTAAAYGYRSYYPPTLQSAPIISADSSSPTKIVPPGSDQAGKAVQDRVANVGREQVVTRQEEPVALRDLGTASSPRVVLPAPVAPAASGAGAAAPAATGSASPPLQAAPSVPPPGQRAAAPSPGAALDAKPIRTERIRSDSGDASGRPVEAPPAVSAPATRSAATAPRASAPPPAAASGSTPLSLQPQSGEGAAPAPRTRTATLPPRSSPETTASTGGHVVQLSSQKSESEAQAVFRSLQGKFPTELGDRKPLITRADLGTKGVVYRTQVGPFASAQEASRFCATYKAAGGQCFVP